MEELHSTNDVATAPVTLDRFDSIELVAGQWDRLIPRDVPALRSGFLRAIERGQMIQRPEYFLIRQQGEPVAAAMAYTVLLDTAMSASPGRATCVRWIRKLWPNFLWRPMRVCGPPISNGECGFYFRPNLAAAERKSILRQVLPPIEASAGKNQLLFYKEFRTDQVGQFAGELLRHGYFDVDPGPGTEMVLHWATFDDYLAALKKRYRRRVRIDAKAGQELEFELRHAFSDLAGTVTQLYDQVLSRATYNVERATQTFFAEVSNFDQSRLLLARHRSDQRVVGANLLLFGDSCMHNLYIGFDYDANQQCRTYFNLVQQSLRIAIEQQVRVCYFGPASYEFKTRLGATTYPLTAYMKHPIGWVHRWLESNKEKLWPEDEIPSHNVFQDNSVSGPTTQSPAHHAD